MGTLPLIRVLPFNYNNNRTLTSRKINVGVQILSRHIVIPVLQEKFESYESTIHKLLPILSQDFQTATGLKKC